MLLFFLKKRSNLRRVHTTGHVELFNFSLNKTMLKLRINTPGNTKKGLRWTIYKRIRKQSKKMPLWILNF